MSTDSDLITRLRAEIDRRETAARDMAKMWPGDWELSDRGWMAKVTADGPVFREVMRIKQEDVLDEIGPYLGDLLRHLELNDPNDTIRHCAADREILEIHQPERHGQYTDCLVCHSPHEGEAEAWPCDTLLALARGYDVAANAPAGEG